MGSKDPRRSLTVPSSLPSESAGQSHSGAGGRSMKLGEGSGARSGMTKAAVPDRSLCQLTLPELSFLVVVMFSLWVHLCSLNSPEVWVRLWRCVFQTGLTSDRTTFPCLQQLVQWCAAASPFYLKLKMTYSEAQSSPSSHRASALGPLPDSRVIKIHIQLS